MLLSINHAKRLTSQRKKEQDCQVDIDDNIEDDERQHCLSFHADDADTLVVDIGDSPDKVDDTDNAVWQHHTEAVEKVQWVLQSRLL